MCCETFLLESRIKKDAQNDEPDVEKTLSEQTAPENYKEARNRGPADVGRR